MVAAAHQVVVLVDSSKIGQEHIVRFARLNDIDVVVTDAGIDDADRAALERHDVEVDGRMSTTSTTGMIVTLTPNPSIDRTVALAGDLVRGAVLRAESVTSQAGGKGVNISRAALAANVPTIAMLPALKDDPFVVELLRDGIDCRPERPAGPIRVNLTLTEPDGTTTKVNTPGAVVSPDDLDRLAAAVTNARARPPGSCSPAPSPGGARLLVRRPARLPERHRRTRRGRHVGCAARGPGRGPRAAGARADEAQR